jgi:hypothetical protein
MISKIISPPIEVTLTLNKSQKVALNRWMVTINNEEKICTNVVVKFYVLSMEELASSFIMDEVEEFRIDWVSIHKYGGANTI